MHHFLIESRVSGKRGLYTHQREATSRYTAAIQPRTTQRYQRIVADDEELLRATIIRLAGQYGQLELWLTRRLHHCKVHDHFQHPCKNGPAETM
jgi:hypothetical protein